MRHGPASARAWASHVEPRRGADRALLWACASAVAGGASAQPFRILELAPIPGYNASFACGTNDAGIVVGSSAFEQDGRATRWVDGLAEDLGALPDWQVGIAREVTSDASLVVGESISAVAVHRPFVWENWTITALPIPAGATHAGAWQVSDAGVIVGLAWNDPGVTSPRACRWEKLAGVWTLTELSPLPGQAFAGALGINQGGVIAGFSALSSARTSASGVRWTGGVSAPLGATVPGASTLAGINDAGMVCGDLEVAPGGAWHAMRAAGAVVVDLGAHGYPNSHAHRVNNSGVVVAHSYADGLSPTEFPADAKRAFIWRQGGAIVVNDALAPELGWDVKQLWDLNDRGRAVGYGRLNGFWRACLVTLCVPDLTGGAVPGQPGYGIPNGTLNNDDFFYYLSQFAAGNLGVADLTTGAVPGQPGYGVPNFVLNNDDFFFYLSVFAGGC